MQFESVPLHVPATNWEGDACLFTPGPLNTSGAVKQAMLHDLGSRTEAFVEVTARILNDMRRIAGDDSLTVIPVQGSGTFAVEAMLTCFLNTRTAHVLVVVNGDYSKRMADICCIHGFRLTILECDRLVAADPLLIARALSQDQSITHLALVHFETGFGVLNNLNEIISVAERHNVNILVDAISTFGAIPIAGSSPSVLAFAVSANKCLHSVPGVSFVIARENSLDEVRAPKTLSLDLSAQHDELKRSGQWRFTPPVQVILALARALEEFFFEGGASMRRARYQRLADRLIAKFFSLGIIPLIDGAYRAPMITTFLLPQKSSFSSRDILLALAKHNLIAYPSRFNARESFRVGCIGELCDQDIDTLVDVVGGLLPQRC